MAHLCVLIIIPPPLNLDPEAGGDIPDALQSTNVASQTYSCLVAKALSTHCTPHISFGGLWCHTGCLGVTQCSTLQRYPAVQRLATKGSGAAPHTRLQH